jgi:hypothetical protein
MCHVSLCGHSHVTGRYGDARPESNHLGGLACPVGPPGSPSPDMSDHFPMLILAVLTFLTVRRCLTIQAVRIGELRYFSFLVIIAQRPRAILFTNAIAKSIFGFLASNCVNHALMTLPFRPAHRMTAISPMTSYRRISLWRILNTLPRRSLPPIEFSRGTIPSQAEKS